jgi:ATP-binding cassette subfamily F protein 2
MFIYIFQVAEEIWVCENGTVTKWQGDIQTYKEHLKEKIVKDKASSKKQFK